MSYHADMRFQVIAHDPDGDPAESRGFYRSLDEAYGCVAFDRLTDWTIYDGDEIAAQSAA